MFVDDAPDVHFEPLQGNAIATIVNRNTVEPQPSVNHQPVRQVQQNAQVQNVNRGLVQQQFPQDMELPQSSPPTQGAVVMHQQVRGGRGRGRVMRGRGIGRGQQQGAMRQLPQHHQPPPQQMHQQHQQQQQMHHQQQQMRQQQMYQQQHQQQQQKQTQHQMMQGPVHQQEGRKVAPKVKIYCICHEL